MRQSGVEATPAELMIDEALDEQYLDFLASTLPVRFDGMRLVIDCANGAASHLASTLFERLGAQVHAIGCTPDGRNINLNAGALHVGNLQREVVERGADAGIAFDGDADRCIMVAPSGKIIDGDAVLLLASVELQRQGRLHDREGKPVVIATVMSNLGLERALNERGIELVRTAVGDKYVLEEMERRGAVLGGEQSGHVIFREFATTGDGMLTALRVLEAVRRSGRDLDELTKDLKIYPQTLVNVRVSSRRPLDQLPAVQQEIRRAEDSFGSRGRVFVRFSGTEPLARVMVEGPDQSQVEHFANSIAGAIRHELGV
jgi:phosphoglucosamine mutase